MTELAIGQRVRSLRSGDETIEGTVVSGVQGHDDMVIVAWDMPRESYEARSDLVPVAARPTPDAEAMEREFVAALYRLIDAVVVECGRTDVRAQGETKSVFTTVLDIYREAVQS